MTWKQPVLRYQYLTPFQALTNDHRARLHLAVGSGIPFRLWRLWKKKT